MEELTDKQYQFTLNYIKNGYNAYQAALDAGYSHNYARFKGPKLLDNKLIFKRISEAHQKVELARLNELSITIADKAKMLMRIIDDVLPVDGEPKRQYYKDALKAINELNKMSGHYAPDKRLTLNVDATKEKLIEARKQYDEY